MKKSLRFKTAVYALFVVGIWMKTYLVQKQVFHLQTENGVQEWILLFNPLSSALLLLGIGVLFRRLGIVGMSFLASVVLYANVLYFRFFNDFITLPVLFQTDNASDLGSSITELVKGQDVLYVVDVLLLVVFLHTGSRRQQTLTWRKKEAGSIVLVAAGVFLANLGLAETERPELLTRSFDRSMLVKNIGTYNYLLYDGYLQSKTKTQKAFADTNELAEVTGFLSGQKTAGSSTPYKGIAAGKNVVVLSFESLQSFVVDGTVFGEPITPFMNELKKSSFYFPNFYHQTGQGKTSDSEFLLENSLYPLPRGSVFFTHAQNTYHALPEVLGNTGYKTSVFHANDKSFWNRDMMYKSLRYDQYYDKDSYEVNEANSVGWGLKDREFFRQSLPYLKEMRQPFYAKFITLTNHFPFTLDEEDRYISEWNSKDKTVNRYFPTVRYTDEAVKDFFASMKEAGLYENTIFVIYGDHYGISENHNEAMGSFLGKEIKDYDTFQLQRVPLLIHVPGHAGGEFTDVGGQIDLRPTLLHLLGVDDSNPVTFGSNLLDSKRSPLLVMRDGSFATNESVWTRGACYQRESGIQIEKEVCGMERERAENHLHYSDRVVYGDLLRFSKQTER